MKIDIKKNPEKVCNIYFIGYCILVACCFITILFTVKITHEPKQLIRTEYKTDTYDDGVNDALTATMLLDLELKLKKESKPWGEIRNIVRTRLLTKSGYSITNHITKLGLSVTTPPVTTNNIKIKK